jgi:putative membrane protein
MYNDYHFWGMNVIWWFVWIIFLVWVFILPFDIPGQRSSKDLPLDVLLMRYASGEISTEEYEKRKKIIENNKK